jgi:hypothetical protein
LKQPQQQMQKTFTRRVALLAGGQALLFSALVGRMYYLQVLQTESFRLLAEENRVICICCRRCARSSTASACRWRSNYRLSLCQTDRQHARDAGQLRILPLTPTRSSGWCASARSGAPSCRSR